MTGRHLEKTVEMPNPKTKEGHKSGSGDINKEKRMELCRAGCLLSLP